MSVPVKLLLAAFVSAAAGALKLAAVRLRRVQRTRRQHDGRRAGATGYTMSPARRLSLPPRVSALCQGQLTPWLQQFVTCRCTQQA